ncbi:MAG: DUF92 domain-containing protein [Candidatus Neomarinimicrobiota bacterium]|nr:MAG: DUF92 domain-containing protein [Candidatus Neomarinimicrobiota bacterium]
MRIPQYNLFSSDWITFTVVLALIFFLIGLSELLRKQGWFTAESTRKIVHVGVGIAVSLSPLYFRKALPPLVLAGLFIVLNALALKQNRFGGMHGTTRTSYGTVFFPLSYFILVLGAWHRPATLMLAMLMMTFADTAGSWVGESLRRVHSYRLWRDKKSLEGSLAVFLTAAVVSFLFLNLTRTESLPLRHTGEASLLVALVVTLAEMVSARGSDNLSVPLLAALAFDQFYVLRSTGLWFPWMVWIFLSAALFFLAVKLHSLQGNGGVTGFLVGIFLFGAGGLPWILPMVLFFILSSALSQFGSRHDPVGVKGSRRDHLQVLANSGAALGLALLHFYHPSWSWTYPVYLGALAAATADTWATEFGLLGGGIPRHIVTGKEIRKGMSGGVTWTGFGGALAGAGLIGGVGAVYGLDWRIVTVIILAGFLASLVDSLLGGTVQALYRSEQTGLLTEKAALPGESVVLVRGWPWMNNDMVNVMNTLCGALITSYLFW